MSSKARYQIELGGKSLTTLLSTCFTREIQLFVVLSASLFFVTYYLSSRSSYIIKKGQYLLKHILVIVIVKLFLWKIEQATKEGSIQIPNAYFMVSNHDSCLV